MECPVCLSDDAELTHDPFQGNGILCTSPECKGTVHPIAKPVDDYIPMTSLDVFLMRTQGWPNDYKLR